MNNHNIEPCFHINGIPDNNKKHVGEGQGYYRGGFDARLCARRRRDGYRGGRNYGGRGYAHQAQIHAQSYISNYGVNEVQHNPVSSFSTEQMHQIQQMLNSNKEKKET